MGGGIVVLCKNSLKDLFIIEEVVDDYSSEMLAIRLKFFDNRPAALLIFCYIHENALSIENFLLLKTIEKVTSKHHAEGFPAVICGDMNCQMNLPDWETGTPLGKALDGLAQKCSLKWFPSPVWTFKSHDGQIISHLDHCAFSNGIASKCSTQVVDEDSYSLCILSDHRPVVANVVLELPRNLESQPESHRLIIKRFNIRNMKENGMVAKYQQLLHYNLVRFHESLVAAQLDPTDPNVNNMYGLLCNAICNAAENSVGVKIITRDPNKRSRPGWFDNSCQSLCNLTKQALAQFNNGAISLEQFKEVRNKNRSLLKKKRDENSNKIRCEAVVAYAKGNFVRFWEIVKAAKGTTVLPRKVRDKNFEVFFQTFVKIFWNFQNFRDKKASVCLASEKVLPKFRENLGEILKILVKIQNNYEFHEPFMAVR